MTDIATVEWKLLKKYEYYQRRTRKFLSRINKGLLIRDLWPLFKAQCQGLTSITIKIDCSSMSPTESRVVVGDTSYTIITLVDGSFHTVSNDDTVINHDDAVSLNDAINRSLPFITFVIGNEFDITLSG